MTVLSDELRALADEIEWLDDQGSFPRKLSWLAARAREIADADDAAAAAALLEEQDFLDARKAAEADMKGTAGKTWAGRALMFLTVAVRAMREVERRMPKKPAPASTGSPMVKSETREETERRVRPASSIITDDGET